VIWHKGLAPDTPVSLASTVTPFVPEAGNGMTSAQLQSSQDAQLLKAISQLSHGG
jgi:hypothetical protein